MTADLGRKSEFAIGERACSSPAAQQRARNLADTLLDVAAFVDHEGFDAIDLGKLEGSEDSGGSGADDYHIVFLHPLSTLSLMAFSMLSTFCFMSFATNDLIIGPIRGISYSKSITEVYFVPPSAGSNVHMPE